MVTVIIIITIYRYHQLISNVDYSLHQLLEIVISIKILNLSKKNFSINYKIFRYLFQFFNINFNFE